MARKRNEKGQFTKGDKGGPGRQPKHREKEYWRVAKTKCTLAEWGDIVGKAIKQALGGDDKARKFIADIMIGNPHKLRERLDAGDLQPVQVETAQNVVAILAQELAQVGQFETDERRAALVGQLSDKVLKALEVSDLAERLERIEAHLREQEK